jgi:K+-sensing histidine kinase KdpD
MIINPAKAGAIGMYRGPQLGEELPPHRPIRENILIGTLCLAMVCITTGALLLFERIVSFDPAPIAYLIPVVVAATRWGAWPAVVTAIASAGAADFFFTVPFYSFRMEDPQEIFDLVLFLFVAFVSGNLSSRLRQETNALRQREMEIQELYEFSRRLAACFTVSDLLTAIQSYLSRTLRQQAAFFTTTVDGHIHSPEIGAAPEEVQGRAASMLATIGPVSPHTIAEASTGNVWLLRALSSENSAHGVIAVNIGRGSREIIETRTRRVEDALREAYLTLRRLDIGKAMDEAKLQLQAQLLRDAFHGTLSHELRSPLAAIQGSASVLQSAVLIQADDRLHSLVEAITEEVERLDSFIQNLLNASRVTAGGIRPRLEWADPKDIANAAIRKKTRQLAAHTIQREFAEYLPLIHVDAVLIEEAYGQLLENAAKYSPSGSTISIIVRAEPDHVVLSVSDQGVGITADERQQLGRRSFRSHRHQATVPGTGLGFWIASTFVKANGGAIDILSRGQGFGTEARIALPVRAETPELAA